MARECAWLHGTSLFEGFLVLMDALNVSGALVTTFDYRNGIADAIASDVAARGSQGRAALRMPGHSRPRRGSASD